MEKKIKNLGVMVDCSRDACYKAEAVENFIDVIARLGYNVLMLYTEDTYALDGEPYFGYMRGRYGKEEWKRLDAYAKARGVELIPCIQTLAHLGAVTRWQEYGEKCVDGNDILLVDQPETYELIEKMFRWAAECFTSRRIHIGMDEAYGGTGALSRSARLSPALRSFAASFAAHRRNRGRIRLFVHALVGYVRQDGKRRRILSRAF
ncbi:MAG: family 20 glycosylhydrolase [Christensenellaceae bacterium]